MHWTDSVFTWALSCSVSNAMVNACRLYLLLMQVVWVSAVLQQPRSSHLSGHEETDPQRTVWVPGTGVVVHLTWWWVHCWMHCFQWVHVCCIIWCVGILSTKMLEISSTDSTCSTNSVGPSAVSHSLWGPISYGITDLCYALYCRALMALVGKQERRPACKQFCYKDFCESTNGTGLTYRLTSEKQLL